MLTPPRLLLTPAPSTSPVNLRLLPPPSTAADYQEEEYVHALGDKMFNQEPERAGQRILKVRGSGRWGPACLRQPPGGATCAAFNSKCRLGKPPRTFHAGLL